MYHFSSIHRQHSWVIPGSKSSQFFRITVLFVHTNAPVRFKRSNEDQRRTKERIKSKMETNCSLAKKFQLILFGPSISTFAEE